jgi:hypothetical protein
MAKIFISALEELNPLAISIEDFLKRHSGHRKALFQPQADLTLELGKERQLGSKDPVVYIYDDSEFVSNIGKSITENFRNNLINSSYPQNNGSSKEYLTLTINVCRQNDTVDQDKYGKIIGEAIVKFFNPEYEEILKHQSEPTNKASKDKTYYDRAFNQGSTSNASLIFKKKS